ncbi:Sec-independent protein translocase subunit TatA [Cellulosimicrobium cellulans]|uniref:Sec-independent protein translocase subunit TatA n=1 Tax=Cellulosimicrobium TaxID=157920 RepID=UPI00087F5CFC|nr:Sec-independent protein translocase subunit TatA [Sphaerisporangium cinnabarinum]MCR1982151.1 Sec-independent protein translocase subunit TatA [Cellulosimicrobium cellulans]PTU55986.1 twin-arginine translocase TatA/TatE family subunit [Sphaerisporangium cinnabarinum]SDF50929.1 sec-independent protein translocase protein TatA [Cellulosimicrobium cellulans]
MNILRHPATIVVLILLVLLLFGSKRLPDMARSVGQSLKIFKKEVKDLREDDDATTTTTPSGTTATTSTGTTTGATTTGAAGTGATSVTGGTASSTQDDTPKA